MKKILEFLSENFQFLVVKFLVYLNRRVFVMKLCFIESVLEKHCEVQNCSRLLAHG